MAYRREVDGLRAIAVLPVILFHAGASGFSGGYVGVDVFFVISGYLITGLILEEKARDRFSILEFYERRARRILPALFVVTLACVPAACLLMFPYMLEDFGKSLTAVWLFASNILFWRESGYFNPAGEENPLLHTWSLAVEEQYYLFFPGLLMLLWFVGRRRLAAIIAGAAVLSLCATEWGWRNSPDANFYLAPTRAWELFVGALLAFAGSHHAEPSGRNQLLRNAGAMAGLGLIVFAIFAFDSETPFPSLLALVPTLGTALVIACGDPATTVGRLLSRPAFVMTGLLSYSLYLWHQPLFAFARMRGDPSVAMYAVLIAVSAGLSYCTWRFVEMPMRNRSFLTRRAIFTLSAAAMAFFIAVGSTLIAFHGFNSRLTKEQQKILSWLRYPRGAQYREGKCFLRGDVAAHSALATECLARSPDLSASVFLWGDSHAAHLFPGLAAQGLHVNQVTAGGCPPVLHYRIRALRNCEATNEFVNDELASRSGQVVLLSANWSVYHVRAAFREALETQLASYSASKNRIVLIGPAPQWRPTLPEKAARNSRDGKIPAYLESDPLPALRRVDAQLREVAQRYNIEYVSLLDALCNDSACRAAADDGTIPMAWDKAHLTREGSAIVAALITRQLNLPSAATERNGER